MLHSTENDPGLLFTQPFGDWSKRWARRVENKNHRSLSNCSSADLIVGNNFQPLKSVPTLFNLAQRKLMLEAKWSRFLENKIKRVSSLFLFGICSLFWLFSPRRSDEPRLCKLYKSSFHRVWTVLSCVGSGAWETRRISRSTVFRPENRKELKREKVSESEREWAEKRVEGGLRFTKTRERPFF